MIAAKDDTIKEEILEQAQKLFQQFGVKKTTMEDIARAMGKGKSTLYYYFCSKEDIFDAVILKEMEEVFSSVSHAVEKAGSAEEKLKAFTLTKIRSLHRKANLYKIVSGEMQDNMRCIKHLHTEYDLRETRLLKEILEFGVGNGEFTRLITKELDILPSVIVSSLRGLERDVFVEGKYTRLVTRMESIVGILIRGLQNTTHLNSRSIANTNTRKQII